MATVQRIDGSFVEGAQLTDISSPNEEGSRSAIAHINSEMLPVYNSIIDEFNDIWVEQTPAPIALKGTRTRTVSVQKDIRASVQLKPVEE